MTYKTILAALVASVALGAPAFAGLSIGGKSQGSAVISAPLPSANIGINSRSSVDAKLPAGVEAEEDVDAGVNLNAQVEGDEDAEADTRASANNIEGTDEDQPRKKKTAAHRPARKPSDASSEARVDATAAADVDTDVDAGIRAETSMKLRLNE